MTRTTVNHQVFCAISREKRMKPEYDSEFGIRKMPISEIITMIVRCISQYSRRFCFITKPSIHQTELFCQVN